MMISMCVLGLLLAMATAYTPSDSQQSHAVLQPPRHCVKVLSNQTQETDLNCNVLTGTVWTFEWVQHWAKEHVQYGLNVYIKCEPNSTVILRQPIKAFLLRKLDINSCGVRQMYDYDLTADTATLAFTVRTLTIQDSVYFITFNELQALYIKYSRDVISKYPCYLPPSVEKYVERNVSVKSEGYGTKKQHMELREASRNHKFKLPQYLPVQISDQERLEPLELEPLELPEVPEVQETQEQQEAIEPLEPLEIEPPEDPCSCAIRCCANPFELMRSTLLLNFHLPEVTSLSCCGCTSCPAGYFIVPVSRPFVLSMMTSMASLRTPG